MEDKFKEILSSDEKALQKFNEIAQHDMIILITEMSMYLPECIKSHEERMAAEDARKYAAIMVRSRLVSFSTRTSACLRRISGVKRIRS